MLKYLSKFVLEILPSIAATVIGAYIVNHYIIARPAANPPAAALASVAPQAHGPTAPAKGTAGAVETAARVETAKPESAKPESAKSEPAKSEPAKPELVKPEPAKSESAKAAMSSPRHATETAGSEKTAESKPVSHHPSEHDVNELARAAIARLRTSRTEVVDAPPQSSERPANAREPHRVLAASAPGTSNAGTSALQPLPAPVTVSVPASQWQRSRQDSSPPMAISPDAATVADNDSSHLVPPADIPLAPLLDLSPGSSQPPRQTTVADDMLSAAKSVFHAVLPH